MAGKKWTREETILAMALYCQMPFSHIHKENPQIVELATQLNRTPGSVGMKMCNLGRFDPELLKRGVIGLTHGSQLDEKIWNEFHGNMEKLADAVDEIVSVNKKIKLFDEFLQLPPGTDIKSASKARKGQAFFSNTVLAAYDSTCCITGINIPVLLEACHIKPWKVSNPENERTNPTNGLCLNSLHHEAFDSGIITIDTEYRILLARETKDAYSSEVFADYFLKYEGKTITLPNQFVPAKEMLEYHNKHVFLG